MPYLAKMAPDFSITRWFNVSTTTDLAANRLRPEAHHRAIQRWYEEQWRATCEHTEEMARNQHRCKGLELLAGPKLAQATILIQGSAHVAVGGMHEARELSVHLQTSRRPAK
jgi:hypothetical protein